jgi:phosphoribosyl 1,2-cyclic phosphodiesterase
MIEILKFSSRRPRGLAPEDNGSSSGLRTADAVRRAAKHEKRIILQQLRTARVTFLGTGTSHGVPAIGCRCATCQSQDPRDHRWRPSILVELPGGATLLVDTAPDLRAQALAFGIPRIDAILYTHPHADHILGLDDIRRFNEMQGGPVPCYGDRATLAEVRRTFACVQAGFAGEHPR